MTDSERLDWLENVARGPEGILVHACVGPTGRLGIGLQHRTLRQAIDQCMEFDATYNAARSTPETPGEPK